MRKRRRNIKNIEQKMYNAIDHIDIPNNLDFRSIYNQSVIFNLHKTPTLIPEKTLYRFIVNEIRHSESNYEQTLRFINKCVKSSKDNTYYYQYKNAVLDKIGYIYPELQDECNRQKSRVDMVCIKK